MWHIQMTKAGPQNNTENRNETVTLNIASDY